MIQKIGKPGTGKTTLKYDPNFDYYKFKFFSESPNTLELCRRSGEMIYPIQFNSGGLLEFEIKITFSWWFAVDSASVYTRDRRYHVFGVLDDFGEVAFSGCDPDFSSFTKLFSLSTELTFGDGLGRIAQFDGTVCTDQEKAKQMDGILKIRPESFRRFGTGYPSSTFTVEKMN